MNRTSLISDGGSCAALLLAPVRSEAQLPRDPVERARVVAQIMEMNARQLTRVRSPGTARSASSGHATSTTSRSSHRTATRMAVVKPDLEKETRTSG